MSLDIQIARNLVKAELKKQGSKISNYDSNEITEVARLLLEKNPKLIAKERKRQLSRTIKLRHTRLKSP